MEKKITIKVTPDEFSVLQSLLLSARDCMEYDECTQSYTDGGRFLLSLNEKEFKALHTINL